MVTMKIRGINKVQGRRPGQVYYYHRATGKRLKAEFGTVEFLAEVERLDSEFPDIKPIGGTFGALVQAYKASPEFTTKAPRTRQDYSDVLDYLAGMYDMLLIEIDAAYLIGLRDDAFKARKRRFTNYLVTVLRLLFTWGQPRKFIEHNPATSVPKIPRPRDARKVNRAWTMQEVFTVFDAAESGLKRGIGLAAFAGMTEGDVVRVTKKIYDGEKLRWNRQKTGVAVTVPVSPRLKAVLDEDKSNAVTLVSNRSGRPYTVSGFRASFFKLIRKLEEEKKVGKGLTFHGLRHTVGKMAIEANMTDNDVAAVLGHASTATAAIYTAEFNREKRAQATIVAIESAMKKDE